MTILSTNPAFKFDSSVFLKSAAPALTVVAAQTNFPKLFDRCEPIAKFYENQDVPARKSSGPFGGHSYTWYVEDGRSQVYQVYCRSDVTTLGLGHLSIASRMASKKPVTRYFVECSPVDEKTHTAKIRGIVPGLVHEVRFPTKNS